MTGEYIPITASIFFCDGILREDPDPLMTLDDLDFFDTPEVKSFNEVL